MFMKLSVLVGDVSFLFGQVRSHVSLLRLIEPSVSPTTAADSMQRWDEVGGCCRQATDSRCNFDKVRAMEGVLLHQHRLLAAYVSDAHVGFADLDAEQRQEVEEQLVERLGQPRECIGDGALHHCFR